MRLIFLGSGEFGLPVLGDLRSRHELVGVMTQPDRPAGRRRQMTPTAVAQWATERGITVWKVEDVNEPSIVERVTSMGVDGGVVIAFGQKLGEALIESLGGLAVNLHASLLPKYRGAAPISWAMIRGERETGLSVIGLAQRMDAGLVYGQVGTSIDPLETAGELHDRLSQMGPGLIEQVLSRFESGQLTGEAQDGAFVSKAPKLSKADGYVDFDADAEEVRCRVHGLTPWPGARVTWVRDRGVGIERTDLILRRVAAETDLSCFIGFGTRWGSD